MNTTASLTEAAACGITLWAEGGALRYGPKDAMTPELAAKLKENKSVLIDSLGERIVPTFPELRYWLRLLRGDGCRIAIADGRPAIQWGPGLDTPAHRREWWANIETITRLLRAEAERVRQ